MTAFTFSTEAFALFVHARRTQLGLTVTEAAEAARVSRPQFFRAERGQMVNVSACITICRWLGKTVDDFAIDSATGRIAPAVASRGTAGETRGLPDFREGA